MCTRCHIGRLRVLTLVVSKLRVTHPRPQPIYEIGSERPVAYKLKLKDGATVTVLDWVKKVLDEQ